MPPTPTQQSAYGYLVFLVNPDGVRAKVPMMAFGNDVPYANVRNIATRSFYRFVIVRDDDNVQVYASHPADRSGAYVPHE